MCSAVVVRDDDDAVGVFTDDTKEAVLAKARSEGATVVSWHDDWWIAAEAAEELRCQP